MPNINDSVRAIFALGRLPRELREVAGIAEELRREALAIKVDENSSEEEIAWANARLDLIAAQARAIESYLERIEELNGRLNS